MATRKRKRHPTAMKSVFFPDDVKNNQQKEGRESTSISSASAAKCWEKCGEGFLGTPKMKNHQSPGKKLSTIKRLSHLHLEKSNIPCHRKDPVDIAWSSSDEDQSGNEIQDQHQPKVVPPQQRPPQKKGKPTTFIRSYAAIQDKTTTEDEIPAIDNDSDLDESDTEVETVREEQISDCESDSDDVNLKGFSPKSNNAEELDIADYLSDGENVCSPKASGSEVFLPQTDEGTKKSVSEWVRSAQAMLQAPKPTSAWHRKAPQDSAKKQRKFVSGGLAERLSRLERRQRSAVSFWRHEIVSDTWGGATVPVDRPGVLVLEVLEVHQEYNLQAAYCEHHPARGDGHQHSNPVSEEKSHMLVLFDRETACHLMIAPKDIVHVHPPWQSLSIEGFNYPVILNTHFSRKVYPASKHVTVPFPRVCSTATKSKPLFLGKTFPFLDECRTKDENLAKQATASSLGLWRRPSVSLLEAIEGLGHLGQVGQDLEVVVQRVFSLPLPQCSHLFTLKHKIAMRSSIAPPAEKGKTRLCMLIQDDYGTFAMVQLHSLSCSDQLHQYCQMWQGRTCVLKNIKAVQLVTQVRRPELFSLIDSLWPPAVPLQVHGNALCIPSESRSPGSAPTFCYLLSGQESSVQVPEGQTMSPLYLPPVMQSLRDTLESETKSCRCSFFATILYKKMQHTDVGQGTVWLVITDHTLQEDQLKRPCTRTISVCVSTSCVLTSSVLEALNSPAACHMSFRDAIKENGLYLCGEHSVIEVCSAPNVESTTRADSLSEPVKEPEVETMPRPVRLDPLSLETTPNSLCSLTGVIVGVDEKTAYSWPVCNLCGSDNLKLLNSNFHCVGCKSMVANPDIKIQLEVFLKSSSINNCTIKVKLLQKTIMSVLNTTSLQCAEGCDVESVLGKEVGPIPAYVQVMATKPALWIGLDEVCL